MDTTVGVNSTVQRGYELTQSGSHTLQTRDLEDAEALRAKVIEATVQAIADGSDPRLG